MEKTIDDYKPIADYAAIGNLRTVALVGIDGAIDWCCFPNLDDPSVFGALLDVRRGGRFWITSPRSQSRQQSYVRDTNVVQTMFDTDGGRLTITDWMPLAGNIIGCGKSVAAPEVHRWLQAAGGRAEVYIEWSPRFNYHRDATEIHLAEGGAVATGAAGQRLALAGLPRDAEVSIAPFGGGPLLQASFWLDDGQRCCVVTRWDSDSTQVDLDASRQCLEDTIATWRGWLANEQVPEREWAGPYIELVRRSELALKLMTHCDSGAMAAAATTSLPEHLGGVRNWDYRYAWIRDAALLVQALVSVGHSREAIEFMKWSERVSEANMKGGRRLQIMYGLHGEEQLVEEELSHLEGYCQSKPVRIGNGAYEQVQLDVYAELICSAYEIARREALPPKLWTFLRQVADQACSDWRIPDSGIWEVRGPKQYYVYSKVQVWAALHRAIQLARRFELQGDVALWQRSLKDVRDEILERGVDPQTGAFKLHYDSPELDAANLLIGIEEFLPMEDPRIQATINATLRELTSNGLVYRYRFDDGLPGEEGAFCLCTFWLVDALALSGRVDEAMDIFEGIVRRANHVGLYSEQIDPVSGAFLGNFPQAFSHIGLINSTLYLAQVTGGPMNGLPPLIGTAEHRAETSSGHQRAR